MIRVEIILKQEAMDSSACPDKNKNDEKFYLHWSSVKEHPVQFFQCKGSRVELFGNNIPNYISSLNNEETV